jgi:ribonucleotide reductase alpha subunit
MWDWDTIRQDAARFGVRNSLLTALMPTASTSQILGNCECFEPYHSNMFKRTTLAGEFIVMNRALIAELQRENKWNPETVEILIRDDGSIRNVPGLPQRTYKVFKTVWEILQRVIIDHAVARSPFVDQSQSMNLYFPTPNWQKMHSAHVYSWENGIKTGLYYLRSQPAKEANKVVLNPVNGPTSGGSKKTSLAAITDEVKKEVTSTQKRSDTNDGDGPTCFVGCDSCSA